MKPWRCKKIRRELVPYLDGELDSEQAREIEEHLTVCARCAVLLSRLRDDWESLALLPTAEPPPDFVDRVCNRAQAPEFLTVPPLVAWRYWAAAAILLLAILPSWWVARQADNEEGDLAQLSEEEREIVQNLPAIRELDLLEPVASLSPSTLPDLIENWDTIERMEALGVDAALALSLAEELF